MRTNFVVRYRPEDGVVETASPYEAAFLPFERFLLWRAPKRYKGQQNAIAYYWFSGTGEHVFCESRLEKRVLQGLDFDGDVAALAGEWELAHEHALESFRLRHVQTLGPPTCTGTTTSRRSCAAVMRR